MVFVPGMLAQGTYVYGDAEEALRCTSQILVQRFGDKMLNQFVHGNQGTGVMQGKDEKKQNHASGMLL